MDIISTLRHAVPSHITGQLQLAVATLVVLWFTVVWLRKKRADFVLRDVPVPPGSVPFFGHALKLGSASPWDSIHDWIREYGREETGNIIKIDFLMKPGIVVSDPKHLRHVMDKNHRNYPKDIELAYKPFLHILGTGLVTSSGDNWERQRKLVRGALRFDILEETADVAKRAVDRLSHRLEQIKGTGKAIEIAEEFRVMTLQVIGELILSMTPEESASVFPELYLPIVTEANIRVWQPWRAYLPTYGNYKFQQTVGRLNTYVSDLIRKRWTEHRAGNIQDKPDILDRILSAVDPATWSEETVRQLRDEVKTFLLAGHETSASMLMWSIYETCMNPDVCNKIKEEGRTVFKKGTRASEKTGRAVFDDVELPHRTELAKLTYTLNALKESLRKYSVVPMISRICKKDDVIDGQSIPAGSKVFILVKATHHNEKLWPEPAAFRPERFETDFEPYNFNAFINGPRNCLGQHLALLEARIVLSLLLQRFTFSLVDDNAGVVDEYTVPVTAKHGMHVFVN